MTHSLTTFPCVGCTFIATHMNDAVQHEKKSKEHRTYVFKVYIDTLKNDDGTTKVLVTRQSRSFNQ